MTRPIISIHDADGNETKRPMNDEENAQWEKNAEQVKAIENAKINTDYDKYMYQESVVGHRISRLANKNTRVSHMVGNKAISFSSIVD